MLRGAVRPRRGTVDTRPCWAGGKGCSKKGLRSGERNSRAGGRTMSGSEKRLFQVKQAARAKAQHRSS